MIVCDALDPFFDDELPLAAANSFRVHLADCAGCQHQLRGRMLESSALTRSGRPLVMTSAAELVSVGWRRCWLVAEAAACLAAAAIVAVWLVGSPPAADSRVVASIRHRDNHMLGMPSSGEAMLDDTLHLQFAPRTSVWVYVDGHRLVLACPGDQRCHPRTADLPLMTPGTYSIVSTIGDDEPTALAESFHVR